MNPRTSGESDLPTQAASGQGLREADSPLHRNYGVLIPPRDFGSQVVTKGGLLPLERDRKVIAIYWTSMTIAGAWIGWFLDWLLRS